MIPDSFRALFIRDQESPKRIETLETASLPQEDVLVQVSHSTINYKDALAVTGRGKVIRKFPMIPGIDLAGIVLESSSADVPAGTEVLCTGQGLGESHWGGYAELARLKAEQLTKLPAGMSRAQSMALGTAGFTAMLAVLALEDHGAKPQDKPVIVTGSTGGVGGVAIVLLRNLGYRVTAVTGRPEWTGYLKELGANDIVDRKEFDRPSKPMESEIWGGAIDTTGGQILATVISQMARHATVAVCGLAASSKLDTTVFPLILRGVTLVGIDSVMCPPDRRQKAWDRLSAEVPSVALERITTYTSLEEVPHMAGRLLNGQVHGRVVVELGS
jgi:acrylyl-CoA reductase (NADPH)